MSGWRSRIKKLDKQNAGVLMLVTGLSKAGKTHGVGSIYQHLDPEDVLWVSVGEGNGWGTVQTAFGVHPLGLDLSEIVMECQQRNNSVAEGITGFFKEVRRDPPKALILDSIDGLCHVIELEIALADNRTRRDRNTGISKLDQRGYGLKLNFIKQLVRGQLEPLAQQGCHVIVTCGLKPMEFKGGQGQQQEILAVPAIGGQGSLELPRVFNEVCEVRRGPRNARYAFFSDDRSDSILGSRFGFPDKVKNEELGGLIVYGVNGGPDSGPKKEVARPEKREVRDREPRRERRDDRREDRYGSGRQRSERGEERRSEPEKREERKPPPPPAQNVDVEDPGNISKDYLLKASDFMVGERHKNTSPFDNHQWQNMAIHSATKRAKEGEPVKGFDRALVRLAYGSASKRKRVRIQLTIMEADPENEKDLLDKAMIDADLGDKDFKKLSPKDLDRVEKLIDKALHPKKGEEKALMAEDEFKTLLERVKGHFGDFREEEFTKEILAIAARANLQSEDILHIHEGRTNQIDLDQGKDIFSALNDRAQHFDTGLEVPHECARWKTLEHIGAHPVDERMGILRDIWKEGRYRWLKSETPNEAIQKLSEERQASLTGLLSVKA